MSTNKDFQMLSASILTLAAIYRRMEPLSDDDGENAKRVVLNTYKDIYEALEDESQETQRPPE